MEEGIPYLLLVNDPEDIHITKDGKLASMIKETGNQKAETLFKMAKDSYLEIQSNKNSGK